MIARLSGQVVLAGPKGLVLDVNGVGYRVAVPAPLLEEAVPGAHLVLHIHTHVREGEISLYGFSHPVDLEFFRLLIGVSGVGPKLALGVLSAYAAPTLARLILDQDQHSLARIHGLGPKTAGRIILELQEKAGLVETAQAQSAGGPPLGEALEVLTGLGLTEREAGKILSRVAESHPEPVGLDVLIEESLSLLSRPEPRRK